MHPAIDILFCCKNIIKGYQNNIINILQELKNVVIKDLKSKNVTCNSDKFASNLKIAYQQAIKIRIMENISAEAFNFRKILVNVPETLKLQVVFIIN